MSTAFDTVETLAKNSACYKIIPQGDQLAVLLYLVNTILANGGIVGSSGQIKYYTSDPNAEGVVPDDQTQPATAYSLSGNGNTYGWNPSSLTWV